MAVPTIEQICCIVGADTPCRHSYAGVLPTVNCRNSQSCYGHTHGHTQVTQSTNPPFPTRQWHTQPSPNASPGHIPCSTLKEMSWMAHKTASAGPVEQLRCAIVLGKRELPPNRKPPRESPPAGGAICLLGLLLSLPLIYNTCPTNRRTPCSSGLSSVV